MKNVGFIDRLARLAIGIVAFILYQQGVVTGELGYVALAVGVVMVLTAAFSFCPLYKMFGCKTCKK